MDERSDITTHCQAKSHETLLTVIYKYSMTTNPNLDLILIVKMTKYNLDTCTGLGGILSDILFMAEKDECWYSIKDVLKIIPPPHVVDRRIYVILHCGKMLFTTQNK